MSTSVITAQDTVRIPLPTSVKIIQDLGRLDEARTKIALLEYNIKNYQQVTESQKLIIQSHEKTLDQSKEIANNAKLITDLCRADYLTLTKKYKGQVRKNRVLFILFVAAGSFAAYQTLK